MIIMEESCKILNEIEKEYKNVIIILVDISVGEGSVDFDGGKVEVEFGVISFDLVFDSSFIESLLFVEISVIMEIVDVVGLKVVENFNF